MDIKVPEKWRLDREFEKELGGIYWAAKGQQLFAHLGSAVRQKQRRFHWVLQL